MVNQPTRIPTTSPAVARFLPAAITVGIVSAIAMNVRSQLMTESRQMDRFFAKYRDPQSEAARQKVFDGAVEDPRKSWFNVLGW
ncbi:hypothetical protein K4K61_009590 [Colletotrichum sp. SAR11_59]|uniref:Uncharacterized protein n=3 Tax=Colletotrichum gloeosporioides species complex TaxID=2707338 RepID=T0L3G6_COLGC|nr:uncharacterized protein CGCA056_v003413 [Colletotrichum aenigma]XP_045257011.1 uncharacterized protein GCG54_00002396 [Colletotrichum gloeosporioides]XP_053037368.1 uncharacterized protein COL26b_005890 [Colletotrichum chrysophilum]EQB46196.1 hypothetical protein CGLO_14766 [Colletotrichum gloeosporioides Cg-14]KAF4813361.1 hypothetical protein CGCSCA5_v008401 [Colletotrichum siamense]KAF4831603.1 hypothetical protein CGCTS75_v005090 [Colletotrichum tropicale]KAI8154262.1 hypothetical prot